MIMCIKVAAVDSNAPMTVDASYGKNFSSNSQTLFKNYKEGTISVVCKRYTSKCTIS